MKYWDLGRTRMSRCVTITGLGVRGGDVWVDLCLTVHELFLAPARARGLVCLIRMYHWLISIGSFVTNYEKDNVLLSPTPPCMNNRLYHLPWIAGNPSPPKWRRRCVSMCVLCVWGAGDAWCERKRGNRSPWLEETNKWPYSSPDQ